MMTAQRTRSVGLMALSCSMIAVLSGGFVSGASVAGSTGCNLPEAVGNGVCDMSNNNEECGYDGGDCCECTCIIDSLYPCDDELLFECLDPNAPCREGENFLDVVEDEFMAFAGSYEFEPCNVGLIGDGKCDQKNNNEECGYDGGDCCECTCIIDSLYPCDDELPFECRDPNAPCRDGENILDVVEDEFMAFTGSYEFEPCDVGLIGDGKCDQKNNNEECGYDGGDCCECTCIIDSLYPCDDELPFECLDPNAPCREGENFLDLVEDELMAFAGSYEFDPCIEGLIGDGECDPENNNEECGYDGGDCCECTCVSTPSHDCGDAGFTCVDPTSGCALVEAGTVTTVSASANAYDVRPGAASMDSGCMVDGCSPSLTRDGITADDESRWSCSPTIVDGGELCEIEFTFDTPQHMKDIQVAFWKADESTRTLEATINGEVYGTFDSYPGSAFNSFVVEGNGVHTVALKSVGATAQEWVGVLEVRFMVEA